MTVKVGDRVRWERGSRPEGRVLGEPFLGSDGAERAYCRFDSGESLAARVDELSILADRSWPPTLETK